MTPVFSGSNHILRVKQIRVDDKMDGNGVMVPFNVSLSTKALAFFFMASDRGHYITNPKTIHYHKGNP